MDLSQLNTSQRQAVTFDGKHLLVLAGAGTGKTRTIIGRAAYLISKGVSPDRIQILTFTKRAAAEIVTRVKSSLESDEATNLNGSTFHSWCNFLLNRYPNLFGSKAYTVIDQDDQLSIMKMICGKNYVAFEDIRIKAQQLLDLYSFARNTKSRLSDTIRLKLFDNSETEETDAQIAAIRQPIATILRDYQEKKGVHKYLDYDDILLVVSNRLNKDIEARRIISSLYDHILVDEMQDTNPLQWELLNPFQDDCKLFCVGDDAQSIYSFRGADFKNVHSFTERVKDSEVMLLQDNYRSTQEVLNISNWLLDKSPIRYNKRLVAARGQGHAPVIVNVRNEWEEADFIAERIIENFTQKNKKYIDHLVLSRSQFYTKSLQAVFIKNKIPFVTYGGRKFMESAHIKDLISALRVVNNHEDEIAWMRYLTLWEGIGNKKAAQIIDALSRFNSILECIQWLEEDRRIQKSGVLTKVLQQALINEGKLDKMVLTAFEIMEEKLAQKYSEDWENKRRPDFPVLAILAKSYSSLSEFITESTLDNSTSVNNSPTLKSAAIKKSTPKDHVIISTIHSAKGLESDTCFVLNVSPGVYPSSRSIGNEKEIEEERRVLYVALTRAKNELIITRKISSIRGESHMRSNSDKEKESNQEPRMQSYFLNELPEELVLQEVYNRSVFKSRDIEVPNTLDLTGGMDFS